MPDGYSLLQTFKTPSQGSDVAPDHQLDYRIVRNLEDMMKVTVVRSTVYMSEQDCPYEEEFDGNDFCSTHFLGLVDGEPASCLRLRFFAEFAKLERLATRPQYRRSGVTKMLVTAAFEHMRRKGYKKIIGHAQDRLIPFWEQFGYKVLPHSRRFTFSDYSYTEVFWEEAQHEDAITADVDPYRVIRPEGDWDRPGILERSVDRSVVQQPAIAAE